ncbi:MAG: hypothetical protein ABWY14_02795 [Tardiphaga sp.]
MNIKTSGRSALFLAAGLWICIAGPAHAQESDAAAAPAVAEAAPDKPIALNKFNKPRHAKKVVAKARKTDGKADKDVAKNAGKDAEGSPKPDAAAIIPPTVANANAQLPAETPADMSAMAAQADSMQKLMAGKPDVAASPEDGNLQVVAADQLNEVDRALSEEKPADKPTLTLARATIDAPAVVSEDDATWDRTSLIGKIFIAFGGLLTMASAARMFMA